MNGFTHIRPILTMLLACAALLGCYRRVEQELVVSVPQMKSEACFLIIQKALQGVQGLKSATPDFEQRTIIVTFDSEKLARRNIEYVVAATGFAANDLPRNEAAYGNLPSGCQ
jgi:copper chaperone CopZ